MLKKLFHKYRHVLLYLIFGVITTAVNFLVYYPLYIFVSLPAAVCNSIAWAVAVLAAFLTNKPFVFRSMDWSPKVTIPEFGKFVVSRIGSGIVETGSLFLLVDIGHLDGNIVKIIVSFAVIVLNYLTSRFLVFKEKE